MKFSVSVLLSVLVVAAFGRPSAKEDGDPLPQTSRVTAFVIDEKGNPSVECWELQNMVESMAVTRKDGSKGRAYSTTLAKGGELDGLDIFTWPPFSPIWPNPSDINNDDMNANYLDLSNTFNLFNIQGGLINFKFSIFAANTDDDGWPDHTFSLENGDDWFYFEDTYTDSYAALQADAADPPLTINTVSATETEVLRLRFPKRPRYKVLHKGGCSFTGISTPSQDSLRRKSHARHSLVKQTAAEL